MLRLGILDSGIGGITVLTTLRRHLPQARYFYLGDTAHFPYGSKSAQQVQDCVLQCVEYFKKHEIQTLIIACNTASSLALEALKEALSPIPVFGVVEPGFQTAWKAYQQLLSHHPQESVPILVLSTSATLQSQAYRQAFSKTATLFFEQDCPLLAPMIEAGWLRHPILKQTALEYIAPYKNRYRQGVVLLACTHYPWIQSIFEELLPRWQIVNSAQAITDYILQSSEIRMSLTPKLSQSSVHLPNIVWEFTEPKAIAPFAKHFIESLDSSPHTSLLLKSKI